MFKYILRRLLMLPLVMIGVTFFLFFLTQRLSPQMRASLYIQDPRQMGSLEEVIQKYGLNDPMPVQYFRWLKKAAKGDLGYSESANMTVASALKAYLPATVQLAVAAMVLVVFSGLWLGIVSAVKKDTFTDNLIRLGVLAGFSLPIFVLGLLLLMVFYGKLGWFAPGEYSFSADMIIHSAGFKTYTGLLLLDSLLNFNFYVFFDVLKHLVLPAMTLCLGSFALMVDRKSVV